MHNPACGSQAGLKLCLCFQFVKMIQPVALDQIDQENDGTQGPCQRISKGNGGQFGNKPDGHGDVADPDQAPAHQHGDHGDGCLALSLIHI